MKLGELELTGHTILAPMAGVTDWAYRTVCAELGAAVTVTEMVSSRALVYQDKKSRSLLRKTPLGVCGARKCPRHHGRGRRAGAGDFRL